jgi:hypothetical protein
MLYVYDGRPAGGWLGRSCSQVYMYIMYIICALARGENAKARPRADPVCWRCSAIERNFLKREAKRGSCALCLGTTGGQHRHSRILLVSDF